MAVFTVTMPDELASEVVTAFCQQYGYSGDNPQGFAQGQIAAFMQDVYRNYKRAAAVQEAQVAADLAAAEVLANNQIVIAQQE